MKQRQGRNNERMERQANAALSLALIKTYGAARLPLIQSGNSCILCAMFSYLRISVALIFCFPLVLNAQYVVRQWNVEHGLPQSSPRCITQTRDGYLWIGTWSGLARFDGITMTVFDAGNTEDFYPSVTDLHEDRKGRLWIGTGQGGLNLYENGKITRFDSARGIPAKDIQQIAEDHDGNVWFSTERGVYVLTDRGVLHFDSTQGLPPRNANQVKIFPDGTVYLGFSRTARRVRLEDDSLIILQEYAECGFRDGLDSSGGLWTWIRGKGLMHLSGTDVSLDRRFADIRPLDVYVLPNQEKWIVSSADVRVLTGDKVTVLKEIDGVVLEGISCVYQDREGIVWLGKEGGGILRLRKKQVTMFTKQDGLLSDRVVCGLEDRHGTVWIGTQSGGLVRRRPGEVRFEPVPPLMDDRWVTSLCEADDGTIWVGTWATGIYTIEKGKVRSFTEVPGLRDVSVLTIRQGPDGSMWIATDHEGLFRIRKGRVTSWTTKNGLPVPKIGSILVVRDGSVWVGTVGGGMLHITGDSVRALRIADGLLDDFISPIHEDQDGTLWFVSKRGLQRMRNGQLTSVTQRNGLPSDVDQMLDDGEGNYWFGSTHGILRIAKADLRAAADGQLAQLSFLSVGKEDGMTNEETAGWDHSNMWKARDGAFWFASNSGAVRLYPRIVSSNPVPPGVVLERVLVDNTPVPFSQGLELQPGQTKIEFRYTGLSFSAPQKVRFRYMLEGFESQWKDARNERFVQYTNLAPGEYTFRVIAANNAGVWNEGGASLAFAVLPAFWQTAWFRIVAVALFLTVGPMLYWYRVKQLTKEKERQIEFSKQLIRSQEEERQRIANELHDSLGQNLLILKNKMLVAQQGLSGNGLGEMSELISHTIEEVRSISHNLRPHQLDQLGVSKTIRALVKNVAEFSSIAFSAEVDDIDDALNGDEDIGLFRIVQESLNNIVKHSEATEVIVSLKRNPDGLVLLIRDNGKGMNTAAEGQRLGEGFGLSGMKERARILGGTIEVRSERERGTMVEVKIPREWKMEDGKGDGRKMDDG